MTDAATSAAPTLTGRPRVLVVEDNVVNQQLVLVMLARAGYVAEVAMDGREALALWGVGRFDLVLMDLQMPVMDGYQLCRAMKVDAALASIPLVFYTLTANAMVGDRETCIAAGMDDFLSKPFRRDDLMRVLDMWRGAVHPAGRTDTEGRHSAGR